MDDARGVNQVLPRLRVSVGRSASFPVAHGCGVETRRSGSQLMPRRISRRARQVWRFGRALASTGAERGWPPKLNSRLAVRQPFELLGVERRLGFFKVWRGKETGYSGRVSKHLRSSEFERDYLEGQLICREGEQSHEMFVIQSGSIRIFKDAGSGELELAVLGKGDFFGEMSVLEGLPRDASAQAMTGTRVLVLTAGALLVRLRRDPTFAFELLRRLSGRVRNLNARLVGLTSRAGSTGGGASLLYMAEGQRSEAGGLTANEDPGNDET